MKDKLTGRYYFKQTWRGLILMVEYEIPGDALGIWDKRWRRAKGGDLPYLKIQIDLA